jgi:hypothetical protein
LRECVLEPGQDCKLCGECEVCDLNSDKICDNCCHCLEGADYRAVEITEIILPKEIKLKRKTKKQL